ncbi:MAG: undecaprenyl-phosphate glucose phosphotransferase [Planctomycetota bacterium]
MIGSRLESSTWLKIPIDLGLSYLVLLAAYALGEAGFPIDLSHGPPDFGVYVQALPVVLALYLLLAAFFRLYRPRRVGSFGPLLLDLLKVDSQVALVTMALTFYYREFSFSRLIVTYFFALHPIVLFVHHLLWMKWMAHLAARGIGTRRTLIVGSGSLGRSVAEQIGSHPWLGLNVVGYVSLEHEPPGGAPHIGSLPELPTLVDRHAIQEVVVAVPFKAMHALSEADELLARSSVGLHWVPDLESLSTLRREVTVVEDMHLFNLRATPLRGFSRFVKRTVDILLSIVLLAITLPFMVVIAIVIRLVDGRAPVLFRQDRVGLDGRVFKLIKFRTMVPDAELECGPVFASEEDTRCTRVGRFLRRTSLDELPQLWNILIGQMSLVGPRPERPHFIQEFRRTIPRYMLRHRMRAGLTGWAQVNGWRGNTSLPNRVQFDLYYLKHWTLGFDLKILFLTLVRGWGKRWNAH